MMARKIDLMHLAFGKAEGTCGECSNLISGRYHDRILRKCTVYGMTHSAASDWAMRYQACGMKNREYKDKPMICMVKASRTNAINEIPGQLSIWEGQEL